MPLNYQHDQNFAGKLIIFLALIIIFTFYCNCKNTHLQLVVRSAVK